MASSGMNWTPRARRLGRTLGALGVVVVLSVAWSFCNHGAVPPPTPTGAVHQSRSGSPSSSPSNSPSSEMPAATVVWTTGGLPVGFGDRLAQLPHVQHEVTVVGGTAWLGRSTDADGTVVDDPTAPDGFPIEVYAADPGSYALFVPAAFQKSFTTVLRSGKGVLGQTSATLRGIGQGGTLQFGTVKIEIGLVVPDAVVGASELFVSRSTGEALGLTEDRYALLDLSNQISDSALAARIQPSVPSGQVLRVFAPGESPYERVGATTVPPVFMKERFGEFVGRPDPAKPGWIAIDPAWVSAHIKTRTVPILGDLTCNKEIFPQLIGALQEIDTKGLASFVHTTAGCYAPRMVTSNPTSGISLHAWGAAIDINAPENPFGATPTQDPRVVHIFEKWGFLWGGDFAIADGMHFEFLEPPSG